MKRMSKTLVLSLVVVVLLTTLPYAASAAFNQQGIHNAAAKMQELKLIKGNASGDLMLNSNITRAEMVTIIVRAFGGEEKAGLLKEGIFFQDTEKHWANGYIGAAKQMIEEKGQQLGLPNGSFNPNGNVTAAETIAFLIKFLGIEVDGSLSWPANYIQAAVKANIISEADAKALDSIKNSPASRGLVFFFSNSAFESYKLEGDHTVYEMLTKENAAPESYGISVNFTANVGQALSIPLDEFFYDPDGDPLTFTTSVDDSNATVTATEDIVQFVASKAGNYTLTVQVNDGTSSIEGSIAVAVTNLTVPTLENIHIVKDPMAGTTRVNVLYPSEEIAYIAVFDEPEGGVKLGEGSELIIFEADDVTIPYYSALIDGGFPSGIKSVYVVVYDANGNASQPVEKPIE